METAVVKVPDKTWAIAKTIFSASYRRAFIPSFLIRVVPSCRSKKAKRFRKLLAAEIRKLRSLHEI